MDRLAVQITERQSYQPFIVRVLHRHAVRAACTARKVVLIASTTISRVGDAYGSRGELVRIERVDRMVDGHSKSERRENRVESNDETTIAEEFVGTRCVCRTERVRARHPLLAGGAGTCPTLGAKQRNREGDKPKHRSTHGWIS